MKFIHKLLRLLFFACIAAVYFAALWMGTTEERRRILNFDEPRPNGDYVLVDITVTAVDAVHGLLSVRVRPIPMGKFALDRNTPSTNLKLFLNSISGGQTTAFPKSVRITPIDTTILLSGNPNQYPFDLYGSTLDVLVTTPKRAPEISPFVIENELDTSPIETGSLVIGQSDLTNSESVPIVESVHASVLGFKFAGLVTREGDHKLAHTNFSLRRANQIIVTSITVMATMLGLAISMLGMVWRVTGSVGEINLLPLSFCIALIFGLPALRGIQPGVPGVGVVGDYISFIWAETLVGVAAIALAWTWILRSWRADREAAANLPPSKLP
jgi:hypothetical protein